jgi:hypothetical protein
MTQWNELDVKPHGTSAAYRRHYRQGTRPCEACRQAESVRIAESAASGGYEARRRQWYRAARDAGLDYRQANWAKSSAARLEQALAGRS